MCNSFFQFKNIPCFKQLFEMQPKKRLALICPYQPSLWDGVLHFLEEDDKTKLALGVYVGIWVHTFKFHV